MKTITLISLSFLLFSCYSRSLDKRDIIGNELPAYKFLGLDSSKVYETKDLFKGNRVVLFYFTPSCPYCRAMINEIREKIKPTEKLKIYFISNSPIQELRNYEQENKLYDSMGMKILHDNEGLLIDYFGIKGVPFIAIFNEENKLINTIDGKSSYTDILKSYKN